jgi:TPR repeat protein
MPPNTELEQSVTTLEARLAALGEALRVHHAEAVANEADALQRALSAALEHLRRSARAGQLPAQLRQRLAVASGRVAAQRESLARASAALDRAIDVLLPAATSRGAYSATGTAERQPHSGMVQA